MLNSCNFAQKKTALASDLVGEIRAADKARFSVSISRTEKRTFCGSRTRQVALNTGCSDRTRERFAGAEQRRGTGSTTRLPGACTAGAGAVSFVAPAFSAARSIPASAASSAINRSRISASGRAPFLQTRKSSRFRRCVIAPTKPSDPVARMAISKTWALGIGARSDRRSAGCFRDD